jgi:hypothetical protein
VPALHELLDLGMRRRHLGSKQFIDDHDHAPGMQMPGPMLERCPNVGGVGERFNGDNGIILRSSRS